MSNLLTTIYSLVFTVVLADASSKSKADELTPPPIPSFLQEFVISDLFAWVFWGFSALAIVATAVAAFTGKLQEIIDFIKNNLLPKKAELTDEELLKFRKQLLRDFQTEILARQQNSFVSNNVSRCLSRQRD